MTVGGREFYVYRYEGKFNDIPNAAVILSYPKEAFGNPRALRVFKSTNAELSTQEILDTYSRECARVRDNLVGIAATKISAGVSTGIGSHVDDIEDKGDDQFEISDGRNVEEVYNALLSNNLQPVMSDYIYV